LRQPTIKRRSLTQRTAVSPMVSHRDAKPLQYVSR
jgi:hypothetical protein